MLRRSATLALACALLALPGCGGDDEPPPPRDPLGEVVGYLPTEALAVGIVSTQTERGNGGLLAARLRRVPATELVLGELDQLVTEAGMSLNDLGAQRGNPIAVSLPDLVDLTEYRTPLAAWMVRDEDKLKQSLAAAAEGGTLTAAGTYRQAALYRAEDGSPAYARAGPILLLARDTDTLRLALDRKAARRGMSIAMLEGRLAGTPRTAPIRLSANLTVALAGPDFAALRKVPWIGALERGTVAVEADREAITTTVALDTRESDLVDRDLPIARGPAAPPVPKYGALRAGLRDPAASVIFAQRVWKALQPEAAAALETAVTPLRLIGIDLDRDLIGNLASPALLSTDLEDSRLRVALRDPEGFADALNKVRFLLPPILGALGLEGLTLTVAPDGATQVSVNAVVVARLAVVDGQLVISTREQDLQRVARAPVESVPDAEGAFVVRMQSDRLRATVARLVGLPARAGFALDGVGDGTLVVRAEPDETRGVLRLDVG
ncbi:MAG: hypothetical protein JHC95_07445 [Solirubrobacteraceae bacterium]|nr:hypothetical protein [Solirubrobacteraceae bacterium]